MYQNTLPAKNYFGLNEGKVMLSLRQFSNNSLNQTQQIMLFINQETSSTI